MASSTDDNLTEYERMCLVLEEKKNTLTERKKRYSELTTSQYNANQELIRMQKALKNQNTNINIATKKYVDINVNLALAEADCEYLKNNLSSHSVGFDQKQELADIGMSREHLQDNLNDYRDLKVKINEQRNNISTQNQSLRQECLNVGFYCKDMRAKMDADIKKHIDHQNFDPQNGPKKHLRNTNKSAMIVANRVLDCREEVLGFFKQQVLKVKREERLAQEERDMLAEKLMTSKENDQAMTENEVDSFVKKQKIFPSSDNENTSENTDQLQHKDGTATTAAKVKKPLQPKPPSKEPPSANAAMATVTANLMGRHNLLGGTARQRRKERSSVFSAVNVDRIGEDLIRGCETEGNTCKLRALKLAMRHHVVYQLSFILMLENELNAEKVVCAQNRKVSLEESVLHSLLSAEDEVGIISATSIANENEEEKHPSSGLATANKTATGGQFGQNLGKLCGLASADIKNDENYVTSGKIYEDMLDADVTKVETDLLSACTATEGMLYRTCIDGITDPWNPATLRGHKEHVQAQNQLPATGSSQDFINMEEPEPGSARCGGGGGGGISCGYRTQSRVLASMRPDAVHGPESGSEDKNGKSEKKSEKNFGLTKWLTVGKFEERLSQILTNDVKAMNDIPIELGLAKLTSIGHTAKHVTIAQAQQQKERERQTMAIALADINENNPEASLPEITQLQEKKVYIAGLEKL